MSAPDESISTLVEQVRKGAKYQSISTDLIASLLAVELAKRENNRQAVKAVRSKLHQVAAAYQEKPIPYADYLVEMDALPADLTDGQVRTFLSRAMLAHASTRERAPILPEFYQRCLEPLGHIHSVLDLASGLNPLSIPWMPLQPGFTYTACDIYADMVEFLNAFFKRFNLNGTALVCDITHELPNVAADLALVLKTVPCLEQLDKNSGRNLLEKITSPNILLSFPVRSLGGKSKGMAQHYERHFFELVAEKHWRISRYEFPGELAFLIQK